MMKITRIILNWLLLASLTGWVYADELKLPLYEVFPVKAIDLRCIESEYKVQLPIPQRWKINKAKINFSYVNSASLLRKNSQLVVRLNGTPLAQIKLDPNAPEGHAEVDLPKLLLQTGYNSLSFAVSQHYAEQCELPCVPELWTRVNLDQAELTLDYDLVDVPLAVSSVANFLFDPKNIDQPKVNIISETTSSELMSLAGVLASGVALRYDYRPVEFIAARELDYANDNLLMGTADYVRSFLAEYEIDLEVSKPLIQLYWLPVKSEIDGQTLITRDKSKALVVITGTDVQQLRVAVESFDILSIPFPDSASMKVHEFDLPEIDMYSGKQMVKAGSQYPFKKLNFDTYTFRGFSAGKETINFRVPPDFLIKPNQYVNLSLNFAYGAGFRVDSVLNIILNDQYVSSIHLDNPRGALVSNYQLALPTYLFQGGENTLSFSPILTPLITENCSFIHAENLFLTLFNSSTLEFPDMPHRIEMPRMDLMFVNGFPFTRWPDGYQSKIYLADTDSSHLSAAFNMIGVLSQRNGYPLLGLKIATELDEVFDGELMMIGTLDKLPEKYLQMAPLKFGELNRVPYPVYQGFDRTMALAFNTQKSELGISKGVLMQFESPSVAGRSVVMLAAKDGRALQRLSLALLHFDVQSAVSDDLALIDYVQETSEQDETLSKWRYLTTSLKVGNSYVTGKGGEISPVRAVFTRDPYLYWGVVLLIALVLVWLCAHLIAKQLKRRKISNESE